MVSGLNRKAFSIVDALLIVFLLTVSTSGIVFMDRFFETGDSVRIEVNGKLYGIYTLSDNRIITVEGPLGSTVIEIKDREVRVVSSSCFNKLCIHQGSVKRGSIICLPNRVVIIVGDSGLDGITG